MSRLSVSVILVNGKYRVIEHSPKARVSGFICPAPKGFIPGDEKFISKEGRSVSFDMEAWSIENEKRSKVRTHNQDTVLERFKRGYLK